MKNEFRDLICENSEESNVFLCGIPLDKNASVGKGAKEAPRVLRELSYDLPPLDRKGNLLTKVKMYDAGDFVSEDFDISKSNMDEFLKYKGFHIVFGGDHSIGIATNRAFFDKKPVFFEKTVDFLFVFWYKYNKSGRGGIGRRAALRSLWGNPWKFESSRPHH